MSSEYPGGPTEDRLMEAMRALAVESTFFCQAVGERLQLTATDFSCLTVLYNDGPLTAGALAERSGLTSGAITGVVDRLERGGWVRRVSDPTDRRRVIIEPRHDRRQHIGPVMAPMLAAARRLHAHLSPDQLAAVADYIESSRRMLAEQTVALRAEERGEQPERPAGAVRVPMGDVAAAELWLSGFTAALLIRGGDLGATLCEVDLAGAAPAVTAHGGRVTVRASGRGGRGRPEKGRITLNRSVPWSVNVSQGASRLVADLSGFKLNSLSVVGGASNVRFRLPAPGGAVPVRVAGGASRVAFLRPPGVGVSLRLRGGASRVVLDGRPLPAMGGEAVADSGADGHGDNGADGHAGSYAVEISGGANRVEIGYG